MVGQLGRGLPRSPQWLRGDKALEVKCLFPREHVVHGAAQLVGEHGERFGFAVLVFEFGEVHFPWLTLADKEHGGFGKGPAQMHVADLFAGDPEPFAVGFFRALDQTTIRHKILYAREAGDVLNLLEEDQRQNLANPR